MKAQLSAFPKWLFLIFGVLLVVAILLSDLFDHGVSIFDVLKEPLTTSLETKSEAIDSQLFDFGGEWWLIFKQDINVEDVFLCCLSRTDDNDLRFFRERVRRRLGVEIDLSNYALYRNDIVLNSGEPVNVYVLTAPDNRNVFVGIYST